MSRSGRQDARLATGNEVAAAKQLIKEVLADGYQTRKHPYNDQNHPLHFLSKENVREAYQLVTAEDPDWWEREGIAGRTPPVEED